VRADYGYFTQPQSIAIYITTAFELIQVFRTPLWPLTGINSREVSISQLPDWHYCVFYHVSQTPNRYLFFAYFSL